MTSAVGLQAVDLGLWLAGIDRRGHVVLGGALGGAEIGVGGAVGDPGQMTVDEAGIGLGFVAGVDLLIGELDEVVAALSRQVGGGREGDVLRRELVAHVVAGEVVAPHQQSAGDRERRSGDDAEADEHAVDGASLESNDRLRDDDLVDGLSGIGPFSGTGPFDGCGAHGVSSGWSDLSPRRYETPSELVRGRRPLSM